MSGGKTRSAPPRGGNDRTPPGRRRGGRGVKILGVFVLLAAVGGWLYLMYGSSAFDAEKVEVTGTHRLTEAEVVKAAGVQKGTPLARVDIGAVESRVLGVTGVKAAGVARAWPHTVRIEITERVPVATVERNGSWWLLDDEAVVVAKQTKQPKLPRLDVANPTPQDAATRSALAVVDDLPKSLDREVHSVSADTPDNVELHLPKKVTVTWGNGDDGKEKARVLALLRDKHPKAAVFDVSTPSMPTVRRN